MAEPMYFQLADFLIYCREIELWEQHKGRNPTEAEVRAYREERDQAVMIAYKAYKTEYDYFKMGDVRTAYMYSRKT
jgi:hypothetical protein